MLTYETLKRLLLLEDENLIIEEGSLISNTLGISAYTPAADKETEKKSVESIVVFEKNYY